MRALGEDLLIIRRSHINMVVYIVLADAAHHCLIFLFIAVQQCDLVALFDPQDITHLLVDNDRPVGRRKVRQVADLSVAPKAVRPGIETYIILRDRMEVRGAGDVR